MSTKLHLLLIYKLIQLSPAELLKPTKNQFSVFHSPFSVFRSIKLVFQNKLVNLLLKSKRYYYVRYVRL